MLPAPPLCRPTPPPPAGPSPGPSAPSPSPIADPALLNPTSDAHIASGVGQTERIHTLLCNLCVEAASATLEETSTASVLFDEAADELEGHLMNRAISPALCSALGIAQPAWSDDGMDTKQGEAILMALGITTPAAVLTAINYQCRGGSPFGRYAPPKTAPHKLRELHEALAALKPHEI